MKDIESLIQSLRNDLEKKDHVILEKDAYILELQELIKLLQLRQFSKRSEKNSEPSGDIFNPDEVPEEPIAPKDDETTTVAAHQRKKPTRKPLPNYLPRVDVIHDLSEEEQVCSCGCAMSFIKDIISEQLDIIPQVVQVLRHIRKKYACKSCEWIFHYEMSRASDVPLKFWEWYQGYIHVDGYAGYCPLEKKHPILLVNCMAHARRKFTEIAKLSTKKNGVSHEVLSRIGKLYLIKKKLKEEEALPDTVQKTRSEKSKPILDSLGEYLVEKQASVLPRSALGTAIAYMLNHWIGLNRYLEDGRLEIDNNCTERSIKPFATGRKNWLFSDSVKGADSSANIYSLIETCKVHGVNPYDYLRHVLIEINKCKTIEDFEKLLPYVYNPPPAFQASPPQAVGTSF